MVKTHCTHNQAMQKDVLNEEDDDKLIKHGKVMRRNGKNGKQKWNSEKKADPKHKSFTSQEEELVIKLHAAIGSRWSIIAQQLPGRTDNDVKILWNSKLRKKLSAMGIDPVTHRPFSQILADYGNIGAFPKVRTRLGSLSRDLKNTFTSSPEYSQIRHPRNLTNSDHNNFSIENNAKIEPSLDLYSQLQAINLVTEAPNYNTNEGMIPYYTTEYPVSMDCTSSMVIHDVSSFSWSDFLLEDVCMPLNVEEHDNTGIFLPYDEKNNACKQESGNNEKCAIGLGYNRFEASSSSNGSFVEAMFERQDEIFPEFRTLSDEEPFYY